MIRYSIITCILLWLTYTPTSFSQRVSPEQASKDTYFEDLRLLPPIAGVNIGYVTKDTKPGDGKYLCGGMSSIQANSAAGTVRRALESVPDDVLDKISLNYIIFCSRTLASDQKIGGIPIPPLNLLMLDVSGSADHVKHLVLHELYHLIEYRFNTFEDVEWQHRFEGYANTHSGSLKSRTLGSGQYGFANSYSQTFPGEDRAELFALLLLQREALESKMDDVLKKKIRYIRDKCNKLLGWDLSQ